MPRIPEIINGKTVWRDVVMPQQKKRDRLGYVITTQFRCPSTEFPHLVGHATHFTRVAHYINKMPRPISYDDLREVFYREHGA